MSPVLPFVSLCVNVCVVSVVLLCSCAPCCYSADTPAPSRSPASRQLINPTVWFFSYSLADCSIFQSGRNATASSDSSFVFPYVVWILDIICASGADQPGCWPAIHSPATRHLLSSPSLHSKIPNKPVLNLRMLWISLIECHQNGLYDSCIPLPARVWHQLLCVLECSCHLKKASLAWH